MIVEPTSMQKEQRLKIPTSGSDCIVISGYASFETLGITSSIKGDEDSDLTAISYTAQVVIGPDWLDVRDVSPTVTRAGFLHNDSDEADATGYKIKNCTWDTVGSPEPNTDNEMIRLIVDLDSRGGRKSNLLSLAYHVVAIGKLAGAVG